MHHTDAHHIYAHPASGNAMRLTWDRAGRFQIATLDQHKLGSTFTANDGWKDREYQVVRVAG